MKSPLGYYQACMHAQVANRQPVIPLSPGREMQRCPIWYHLGYGLIKAYHGLWIKGDIPADVKVFIAIGPPSLLNRKNGKDLG
jgi:hypothetical protein